MKKKYINPQMQVEVIAINEMVCTASNGTLNKDMTITNSSDFGVKSHNDEEDTEENGWSDGLW